MSVCGFRWSHRTEAQYAISQSAAFSSQHDLKSDSLRRTDAIDWYFDKGHCLASEPIETDDSLRQRLHRSIAMAAGDTQPGVQLYVVAPPLSPERGAYPSSAIIVLIAYSR